MKKLSVPFIQQPDAEFPWQEMSEVPWKEFNYKPDVQFGIVHSGTDIHLKYLVDEQALRCETTTINGPVWQDSCVEFFVSFDNSGYYNFEFNCIGTPLVAFGPGRANRNFLPIPVIKKITCVAKSLPNTSDGFHWELSIQIPVSVFQFHNIDRLNGLEARCNFYKCGDLTPVPHFLCWNPIEAPSPDFHLPQYFGQLSFLE